MAELIKDFKNQKVVDYLNTCLYDRVLLRFYHGLGDAVMFQPVLEALRNKFPTIDIDIELRYGQEKLWESHAEKVKNYDVVFEIGFPCSEWSHPEYTKGEWCCIQEIGIPPVKTPPKITKEFKSPLVGMHFFSTCCRGLTCPEPIARKLHDKIIEAGLVPIDTNMRHATYNGINKKFSWNTCAIEDAKADLLTLSGVLQRCCGFTGSVSGNFNLAAAMLEPERILFIKTQFSATCLTRSPVLELDANRWDDNVVNKWLENIKK